MRVWSGKTAGLFFLAIGMLALAGCAARSPEAPGPGAVPESAPPLRVGIAPVYPPLAFKQDGQLAGIEVDFANRLSRELGRPVEFVETGFDELLPALVAKRYDVVMTGYSVTPERQQQATFTQPYMEVGQMTLLRAGDYGRLRTVESLNQPEVTVAAITGTTGEAFVEKQLPDADLRSFPAVADAVQALRNSVVDAFVIDGPAIWDVRGRPLFADDQLRGVYLPLTREMLAWAVRKEDTRLRETLDAQLGIWKANGVVEQILDFWLPVRKVSLGGAQ